ncbi:unnamed protein product [Amoebophrya sp. A25]|nr:unnamed protein product [Amoebophrya sp. A25]|eukprot:GSA25T00008385001.1
MNKTPLLESTAGISADSLLLSAGLQHSGESLMLSPGTTMGSLMQQLPGQTASNLGLLSKSGPSSGDSLVLLGASSEINTGAATAELTRDHEQAAISKENRAAEVELLQPGRVKNSDVASVPLALPVDESTSSPSTQKLPNIHHFLGGAGALLFPATASSMRSRFYQPPFEQKNTNEKSQSPATAQEESIRFPSSSTVVLKKVSSPQDVENITGNKEAVELEEEPLLNAASTTTSSRPAISSPSASPPLLPGSINARHKNKENTDITDHEVRPRASSMPSRHSFGSLRESYLQEPARAAYRDPSLLFSSDERPAKGATTGMIPPIGFSAPGIEDRIAAALSSPLAEGLEDVVAPGDEPGQHQHPQHTTTTPLVLQPAAHVQTSRKEELPVRRHSSPARVLAPHSWERQRDDWRNLQSFLREKSISPPKLQRVPPPELTRKLEASTLSQAARLAARLAPK